MDAVYALTALPTGYSSVPFPLRGPLSSLRYNNIEIKLLITVQWPLSVQGQGRVTRLLL